MSGRGGRVVAAALPSPNLTSVRLHTRKARARSSERSLDQDPTNPLRPPQHRRDASARGRANVRVVSVRLGHARVAFPLDVYSHGRRMDRDAADRTVKQLAPRARITTRISPYGPRQSSSPQRSRPVPHCATSNKQHPPTRVRRRVTTGPATASTTTRPTTSLRSSPEPRAQHEH